MCTLALSLPTYLCTHTQLGATFTSDVHTQCKYISNTCTHKRAPMYTKTNGCKYVYTISPSPPSVSHPTPMHIPHSQHTSTATPMVDLPWKLHQLHSTSVSELWSAIAARILAEEYWRGSLCTDSFVSVEQSLIPFSISRHSAVEMS